MVTEAPVVDGDSGRDGDLGLKKRPRTKLKSKVGILMPASSIIIKYYLKKKNLYFGNWHHEVSQLTPLETPMEKICNTYEIQTQASQFKGSDL